MHRSWIPEVLCRNQQRIGSGSGEQYTINQNSLQAWGNFHHTKQVLIPDSGKNNQLDSN